MAARRRRIRGDRAFKRLIARLPEAIRAEMVEMLEAGGDEILAMQQAGLTYSNRVRAALSKRVLRGTLQLKVGLVGRPLNRRLWFSRIGEKGRKAQIAQVVRRTRSGGRSSYQMRVSALAARPAIYSAEVLAKRQDLGGRLSRFWDGVLKRASMGLTDD